MQAEQLESDFLAACTAVVARTGERVLDICSVLNQLATDFVGASDAEVIDMIDQLMDDLFRRGRLTCPGHRWLPGPVTSIRHVLTRLMEQGYLRRDTASGVWAWQTVTLPFVVWDDGEVNRLLGRS